MSLIRCLLFLTLLAATGSSGLAQPLTASPSSATFTYFLSTNSWTGTTSSCGSAPTCSLTITTNVPTIFSQKNQISSNLKNGSPVQWLSVTANNPSSYTVTVAAANMTYGAYLGTLTLLTVTDMVIVPITFNVFPTNGYVSPTSLTLTSNGPNTISITNPNLSTFNLTATINNINPTSGNWLKFASGNSSQTTVIGQGGAASVNLSVNSSALQGVSLPNGATAEIAFTDSNNNQGATLTAVMFTPPPSLISQPPSLSFSYPAGGSANSQQLSITTSTGVAIPFTAAFQSSSFNFQANPSSCVNEQPQQCVLNITARAGLQANKYNDTLVLTPTNSSQGASPLQIHVSLSVQQQVPVISNLSPNSTTAGTAGFILTVTGSGFASGATIDWNGTPLQTTFVSASQLTASVSGSLIASPGTVLVTVASGGQTSVSLPFTINPAPSCTYSLNPTSTMVAAAGGAGQFSVTAGMGCAWTASPDSTSTTWLHVTSGATGAGNGIVAYSADSNSGSLRNGQILVMGNQFMVTQIGLSPPSTATITATPNPIQVCDGSGTGQTTLTWSAPGATNTEVRFDTGAVYATGGSTGSVPTGKWITNFGLNFNLYDVSGGQNVKVASVFVTLTTSGCE